MVNKKSNSKKHQKNLMDDFNVNSLKVESRNNEEKQIKKDFKQIDSDKSGYIDLIELKEGLKKYGIKMSIVNTKKLLKKYDNNPDSKLDINEFVQLKRDMDERDFRNNRQRKTRQRKTRQRKTRQKKTRQRKYK